MKYLILFFLFIYIHTTGLYAMDIVYKDTVYQENIKTVRFTGEYLYHYPVIYLNSQMPLTLTFDELNYGDDGYGHFNVDIINCDADWNPSSLMPMQFYNGYNSPMIQDYQYSQNTLINYLHYRYSFPQEGESFRMSGNYLLMVYRDGDKEDLILTRRFIVADNKIQYQPLLTLTANMPRTRFSSLHFNLNNVNNMRITNPNWDLQVKVLQNFRWDNAQSPKILSYINNTYRYDVDINQGFDSGNEFRWMDIRSVQFYGNNMESAYRTDSLWHVILKKDVPRSQNTFLSMMDNNGSWFTEVQEWNEDEIEADYVKVHFTFKAYEEYDDLEMYVTGGFCDWQTGSGNQLYYNERLRHYEGEMLLKQGHYDYTYVVKNPKTGQIIESLTEGTRRETENYYTVLVYYKNITDFSHQLIGCFGINF